MKKIAFDKGWRCYAIGKENEVHNVSIPHDAMLYDDKSETSPAGVNTGWYEANDYVYENTFFLPESCRDEKILFEFEGVYQKASVYVNDVKVAYQDYGYMGFYVDPKDALVYGKENRIKVVAVNHEQPNSRWYSGTGIYRPVWIYYLPKQHIAMDGIKITVFDYKNPKIKVSVDTVNEDLFEKSDLLSIEIMDNDKVIADCQKEIVVKSNVRTEFEIALPGAELWEPEHPYLYTCKVTYGSDTVSEQFGVRMIGWDTENGFTINGERVILRGACIHHDNGLLGACAYDFSEYRKIRILKDAGYNAIRSAHNPCSKAMLRACDALGMLVMDEYVDVWYIHKTKYDYATKVENNYEDDLKRIVDKDYNHPSVVLYSTGNEVAESAQKRGIALCQEMTDYLNRLDPTRPVTCGINIFFNFLSAMGFGIYSDKKADQAVKNAKKKKAIGSEFFNVLAGILGADFMKFGATLYPCDLKTKDAYAAMNIAGYNYGIFRYQHDLKKYKNRLILGSETFCSDAYRFWEMAKQNKRLIGDFVWAGMDYLGEVGIGSWEYKEYAPRFDQGMGWVSAGSGRIDLTGKLLAEMKYTRVAFELDKIGMAVIPVSTAGQKHSPSAWKMTNAMESWSWEGCEGKKTKVEVYARAASVSLFLNGNCIGSRKPHKDCKVVFPVKYANGELKAIAYDANGKEIATTSLSTAGKETRLTLEPELRRVQCDGDLCYIRMHYTDENGVLKPMTRGDITVEVENATLIGLGSACPYYEKSYLGNVSDTYYGEAMAIVRPDKAGTIVVKADSPYGSASCTIVAEEAQEDK